MCEGHLTVVDRQDGYVARTPSKPAFCDVDKSKCGGILSAPNNISIIVYIIILCISYYVYVCVAYVSLSDQA